jgi:hypothetical protein
MRTFMTTAGQALNVAAAGHQVEPDPAEMAERYGAGTSVLDWRDRLVCSRCGSRALDMVVTGTERRHQTPSGAPEQSAALAPRGVSVDLWRRCRGEGARALAAADLSGRLARVCPFVFDELRDRLSPWLSTRAARVALLGCRRTR